jgi:hypothetical protein
MICTILTLIIIVMKSIVVFLVCFIGLVGLSIFIDTFWTMRSGRLFREKNTSNKEK